MIGPSATGNARGGNLPGCLQAPTDQVLAGGPVQARAAMRRIHGLRHPEAETKQFCAVCDGGIPVNRRFQPRIKICLGIGYHMGSCISDTVEGTISTRREILRHGCGEWQKGAVGDRQI